MEHSKGVQREMGRASRKHLDLSEVIASNQVGEAFGPSRLVYNIRSARGSNPGGEKYGGRNYRVDLDKAECSCNIPQLLHVPCSHVISACRCRGLDHESEKFMSPFLPHVKHSQSVGVELRALPRSDTIAQVLWVGLCS
jgi:hypothetical protein